MKPTEEKNLNDIMEEWNELASIRDHQIQNEIDVSYHRVLKPEILNIIFNISPNSVIDVGCGAGDLLTDLHGTSLYVTGVDLSNENIERARARLPRDADLFAGSLGEYLDSSEESNYDLAVSNMVLQCVPDISEFLGNIHSCLSNLGWFVFSFPHPCYWPRYWGYESENWFKYSNTIYIEGEFKISRENNTSVKTTHIHRPLSVYIKKFGDNNLNIMEMREPIPSKEVMQKYPNEWKYPRFIVGAAKSV